MYALSIDDTFHWMCHTLGMYFMESLHGMFIRLPNSIHVPYSFVSDIQRPERRTIFICYLYFRINHCMSLQYYYGMDCQCGICKRYVVNDVAGLLKRKHYLDIEFQEYLRTNNLQEFDPFFRNIQFSSKKFIPDKDTVIYPKPCYAVV